jgi:hypothetical protein
MRGQQQQQPLHIQIDDTGVDGTDIGGGVNHVIAIVPPITGCII